MRHFLVVLASVFILATLALAVGCGGDGDSGEGEHGERSETSGGEHGEGSEGGEGEHGEGSEEGEGDEESGVQYGKGDTFDEVRAGARLVIRYDSAANAFTGTVENTTDATLRRVRVEVHLSNGVELGPTTPTDVEPGRTLDVKLPATTQPFDTWSAHPEVGGGDGGG